LVNNVYALSDFMPTQKFVLQKYFYLLDKHKTFVKQMQIKLNGGAGFNDLAHE
jgi:hypothetical protein